MLLLLDLSLKPAPRGLQLLLFLAAMSSVRALLLASLALSAAWVHAPPSRPRPRLAALPSDLGELTVPELKEELKSRGLQVGGVKRELIARLTASETAAPPAERISLDAIEAWLSDTDGPDVAPAGGFAEDAGAEAAPPSLAPDLERSRAAGIDAWLEEAAPAAASFGDARVEPTADDFRSGFVTLVGMPNVGKSTLMNCLLGEHLSVATSKAQTTRHRILGVANGADHQLVLQDTPGILEDAKYTLHERMMGAVRQALDDGEVVLLVTDPFAPVPLPDEAVRAQLRRTDRPLFVAINKVDLYDDDAATGRPRMRPETRADAGELDDVVARWRAETGEHAAFFPISARDGRGVDALRAALVAAVPMTGAPLYPRGTLTDRPQRFFAAELIRAAIFENYGDEVPYSCEVRVDSFKAPEEASLADALESDLEGLSSEGMSSSKAGLESEPDLPVDAGAPDGERRRPRKRVLRIGATVLVSRDSQKGIIIGKRGAAIRDAGTAARHALEDFFREQIHLDLRVAVAKEWRKDEAQLQKFGYTP